MKHRIYMRLIDLSITELPKNLEKDNHLVKITVTHGHEDREPEKSHLVSERRKYHHKSFYRFSELTGVVREMKSHVGSHDSYGPNGYVARADQAELIRQIENMIAF